jgi:hypothetical protein
VPLFFTSAGYPDPQAWRLDNLFGGYVPLFFTPAMYPDLIIAADCRHPISRKTSQYPKWIFYEKFPA